MTKEKRAQMKKQLEAVTEALENLDRVDAQPPDNDGHRIASATLKERTAALAHTASQYEMELTVFWAIRHHSPK